MARPVRPRPLHGRRRHHRGGGGGGALSKAKESNGAIFEFSADRKNINSKEAISRSDELPLAGKEVEAALAVAKTKLKTVLRQFAIVCSQSTCVLCPQLQYFPHANWAILFLSLPCRQRRRRRPRLPGQPRWRPQPPRRGGRRRRHRLWKGII